MNIVFSSTFKRAFKHFTKNNSELRIQILKVIEKLSKDPFNIQLKTHKLSGNLYGLYSCKCGFDCRIIFEISRNEKNEQELLIVDIGTHDTVY